MKAVFVTTRTNEVDNHIAAWDSLGEPCTRLTFAHLGVPEDDEILARAREIKPGVIFYVGAASGFGLPSVATFRALRDIAPCVNLCSDAADPPWFPVLDYYRRKGCFDLQVSIDGARNEHVDHATLTPVDPGAFAGHDTVRDILCGFSGTAARGTLRGSIVGGLKLRALVNHRVRHGAGGYADHGAFLKRCLSTINVSFTGSTRAHHVKGRVTEAGWADCALLEPEESPAKDWLPARSFITYRIDDLDGVARLLANRDRLHESSVLLGAHVRKHLTPRHIYGGILERIGLSLVDPAVTQPAA